MLIIIMFVDRLSGDYCHWHECIKYENNNVFGYSRPLNMNCEWFAFLCDAAILFRNAASWTQKPRKWNFMHKK